VSEDEPVLECGADRGGAERYVVTARPIMDYEADTFSETTLEEPPGCIDTP